MKIFYSLKTLDPIILSQTTATTNNHQGLDHIPGSAMLGMMAAKLYGQDADSQADNWRRFHSGEVKFGPAYAMVDGQLSLPIPASFHLPKGEKMDEGDALTSEVVNHAIEDADVNKTQFEQCRTGYFNAAGQLAKIEQGMITKTALDSKTSSAKNGSLFSFAYLSENQTFVGWVDCHDPIDAAEIREALEGVHRLGRARGSEFGRVAIRLLDGVDLPESTNTESDRLVLWCLSDCQCFDAQGLPTYSPSLSMLCEGAQGQLNLQQSFVQTTQVTRFNQKRGGFDSEQLLIAKGSVLVFDDVQITSAQLQMLSNDGVGFGRQQGLGWVMVNPTWSNQETLPTSSPLFVSISVPLDSIDSNDTDSIAKVNSPLLRWVAAQSQKRKDTQSDNDNDNDNDKDEIVLEMLVKAYRSARAYNRVLIRTNVGPSRSQWRRIENELRYANADWRKAIFDNNNGVCKTKGDEMGWGIEWDNGEKFITFRENFEELIKDLTAVQMRLLLEKLTRYDLSQFNGLKQICVDLKLPTSSQNNDNTMESEK